MAGVGGGGGGGGGGDGCGYQYVSLNAFSKFFKLYFHYSLEIICITLNNSFLTSVISLQAIFGI